MGVNLHSNMQSMLDSVKGSPICTKGLAIIGAKSLNADNATTALQLRASDHS